MNKGIKVVALRQEQPPFGLIEQDDTQLPALDANENLTNVPAMSDYAEMLAGKNDDKRSRFSLFINVCLFLLGAGWLAFVGTSEWSILSHQPFDSVKLLSVIALATCPLILLLAVAIRIRPPATSNIAHMPELQLKLAEGHRQLITTLEEIDCRLERGAVMVTAQGQQLEALSAASLAKMHVLRSALQEDVSLVKQQAADLKAAASVARSDMAIIMSTLPKAHVETRKMANAIMQAGLNAKNQSMALQDRLLELKGHSETAQEVADHAAFALAAQMTQMESQAFAMRSLVKQSQTALEQSASGAAADLRQRVDGINQLIAEMARALAKQNGLSVKLSDNLSATLADVEARLAVIENDGMTGVERLSGAILGLAGHSDTLQHKLSSGETTADALIGKATSLLIALEAAASELSETLPSAFDKLEHNADSADGKVSNVRDAASQLADIISAMSGALAQNEHSLIAQTHHIQAGQKELDAHASAIITAAQTLERHDDNMKTITKTTHDIFLPAINIFTENVDAVMTQSQRVIDELEPALKQKVEIAISGALSSVVQGHVREQLGHVTALSEHAVAAADASTERLMRQMLTIAETSANFEAQLEEAKRASDAKAQNSSAKRVALLIESLNSISIDVTKMLGHDVTDAAWASYLRGDRGVFTRRAVRLIDGGDTREILRHYDSDATFREHVNHYIHDFEAMMRIILSAQENGPLSITLLSSDMGKLYVALAQSIERLRT